MSERQSGHHRRRDDCDPRAITSVSDFAHQLTQARLRAGLTVRQVARAVRVAPSTAGDYFSGRHLPPVRAPHLLTAILAVCGIEAQESLDHWHEALVRVRMAPGRPPAGAPAPYRGLQVFEEEDADWFFGREELTATLTGRLRLLAGSGGGLLAVVGPSGSGKSSLLRAGLIPAVRGGALTGPAGGPGTSDGVVLMVPGRDPAEELAARLRELGADRSPLVVVDQFEGLFTMCGRPDARSRFTELLGSLRPGLVVIGLRADFYAQALRFPLLADALQNRQLVVGPMSPDEMNRAITGPARKAGLEIESGLVELLLRDLAPRASSGGDADPGSAAHDPGALPFLSHALHATWQRASRSRLTVAAYRDSGGIRDAVAHTAEAVFAELSDVQQDIARLIFLRLVHVTDDTLVSRRRAQWGELLDRAEGARSAEPTAVLAAYVEQRLITADSDTVEISHESLLTAWPRLRDWIGADRDGLRVHQRLTEAARNWKESGRDAGLLLRGTSLALTGEWAADAAHRDAVNTDERVFLDASLLHEEQERRAARNRTRRLRQLLGVALALVLVACGLSVYAQRQRDRADRARTEAVSRQLAAEAGRIGGHDPSVSAQLALAAYQTARTQEARARLMDSSAAPSATRLNGFTGLVQSVVLDSGRRLLAAGSSDGTVRLWSTTDRTRPRRLARLRVSSRLAVFAVALSPDGRTLVAGGGMGLLHRWDISDPERPSPLPDLPGSPDATVYSLAFAPDGRGLAVAGADHTVRLWADGRTAGAAAPPTVFRGGDDYQQSVAFSPDGSLIAAAGHDGKTRLWRTAGTGRETPIATLGGFEGPALGVAFSPDGRSLAVCSQDRTTRLWDIADPTRPRAAGTPGGKATSWLNAVAFSPDGGSLAIGGSDDAVRLWDRDSGYVTATLPHPGAVTSMFWFDRQTLVTGCADGVLRLWSLPAPVLTSAQGVNALAYSPDSRLMAIGTLELQLWDLARHQPVGRAWSPGADAFVQSLAFSPRGRTLAVGYSDAMVRLFSYTLTGDLTPLGPAFRVAKSGTVESLAFNRSGTMLASGADDSTVRLFDTSRPARVKALRTLAGATDAVLSVSFTPDGRHIAAGSIDRVVRVWATAGKDTRPLVSLGGPTGYVWSVAFSPDGRLLAAGSADRTVRMWDTRDIRRPVRVGPELTGFASYVYSLAFSPDGGTLAAGSTDSTVWLFDVTAPRRPEVRAVLTAASGHVYAVAFSPDGESLAAGGEDHTVRLWKTDTDAIARHLCESRGDPLSESEWQRFSPSAAIEPSCR
ncbi:helix-turn-helix domain-containing protein [Streptomyces sp. NPDC006872]|uniref:nSTAND1 domain-containing NTPase n=1 Tax=Streptomyces sp. NPDC006872 TaxID=3155720 RepID=UPI0033CBAD6B